MVLKDSLLKKLVVYARHGRFGGFSFFWFGSILALHTEQQNRFGKNDFVIRFCHRFCFRRKPIGWPGVRQSRDSNLVGLQETDTVFLGVRELNSRLSSHKRCDPLLKAASCSNNSQFFLGRAQSVRRWCSNQFYPMRHARRMASRAEKEEERKNQKKDRHRRRVLMLLGGNPKQKSDITHTYERTNERTNHPQSGESHTRKKIIFGTAFCCKEGTYHIVLAISTRIHSIIFIDIWQQQNNIRHRKNRCHHSTKQKLQ